VADVDPDDVLRQLARDHRDEKQTLAALHYLVLRKADFSVRVASALAASMALQPDALRGAQKPVWAGDKDHGPERAAYFVIEHHRLVTFLRAETEPTIKAMEQQIAEGRKQ
jgi:hypothetical protein